MKRGSNKKCSSYKQSVQDVLLLMEYTKNTKGGNCFITSLEDKGE